jgi:hypothetical protein
LIAGFRAFSEYIIDFLRAVKGGFFLRKKPLECVLSVYTNSENALAAEGIHNSAKTFLRG